MNGLVDFTFSVWINIGSSSTGDSNLVSMTNSNGEFFCHMSLFQNRIGLTSSFSSWAYVRNDLTWAMDTDNWMHFSITRDSANK